ncbi:MAG TPA: serine/threonine-protein kinase [Gemmataceae bacterium]|nr:serine/threonine-protein kinase [Gemmataceae bacterium]
MSDSDRVLDLLVEWEELRRQGKAVTAEQLCPDDPELREKLRQRIRRRERIQALLEPPGDETRPDELRRPDIAVPNIAGYEILEVLGQGGMGVVYKARQTRLNRLVALKMIRAGANAGPQELERFRTEAEAVARLEHPNIVQIYEIGEQGGRPFLALEFVRGGSLARRLDGTPLPACQAARLVQTLARAVHHAHQQGIVHRDLKPANVLLTADGTPKIADFGLAKRLDADRGQTQTGAVLGSPSYMAPEQAEGRIKEIGPAVDIYALGAILYELLTGRPPFQGATLLETLEQVRGHDPVPPRDLQPSVPRDLETVCLKCLEKTPGRRYASALELADDLQRFLDGDPIRARSATLLDYLTRTISHTRVDPNFRTWGTWALTIAPLPLLLHLTVFLLFHGQPHYPLVAVCTSGVTVLLVVAVVFFGNRAALRRVASEQRRHLSSTWLAHVIGFALMPVVVFGMAPPRQPDDWFFIYPLWAILAGTTFFSMGGNAGLLYVIGCACFVLALLITWAPAWAPLEVGLLMSINLTTQGLFLRRLGSEAGAKPTGEASTVRAPAKA